jgi:hypothetical protein
MSSSSSVLQGTSPLMRRDSELAVQPQRAAKSFWLILARASSARISLVIASLRLGVSSMRDNVALCAISRKPKGYTAWRDGVTLCGMDTASTPVEQRVAAEARAQLARRRISGRQVSAMLGWTPAYVSRRLTGQIPFSLSDLEALAMALDMPISGFITLGEWFRARLELAA